MADAEIAGGAMAPPVVHETRIAWLRRNFFAGPGSTLLTLVLVAAVALLAPGVVRWMLTEAVWSTDDPTECRAAAGACWAVITEKHRVMLFGTYPYNEQWRGAAVTIVIVGMMIASGFRRLWSPMLLVAWIVALVLVLVLQMGGLFGLLPVSTNRWGGLPLTLLLFVGTVAFGIPLAIVLALGRRSQLPAIKALSVGYIEIVRGIPLVNVLFMASLLFPLFVPEGMNPDKLLRAQIAMILFFAAYAAEVVRGGLQAVPLGQYEAADSLGVGYIDRTAKIILPQALRIVIPPLVNDIIRAFKNTSLLLIIGLFDLLGGTMAALQDPPWSPYYVEAYLFLALVYFLFCFSMSQYSQRLEAGFRRGRNF